MSYRIRLAGKRAFIREDRLSLRRVKRIEARDSKILI